MEVSQARDAIVVHTPAKLNLFLEILSRRLDGYHELETLMVAIDIRDTLVFTPTTGAEIELNCGWSPGLVAQSSAGACVRGSPWEPLPTKGGNLVERVIERLRESAGVAMGARILLRKRIPAAAGLGGASSDAAAALTAANLAWQLGWSSRQLAEFGANFGSDIPFFFSQGPAVCRGRGQQVETVVAPARLHLVVVRPPAGLSTAAVYQACQPAERPRTCQPLLAAWWAGDLQRMADSMHNQLQPAAERLSPWIARLRHIFDRLDVLGHQMSGSGTSYFGLCRHARHARHVAGRLRCLGLGAVFAASTDRSILPGTFLASPP